MAAAAKQGSFESSTAISSQLKGTDAVSMAASQPKDSTQETGMTGMSGMTSTDDVKAHSSIATAIPVLDVTPMTWQQALVAIQLSYKARLASVSIVGPSLWDWVGQKLVCSF